MTECEGYTKSIEKYTNGAIIMETPEQEVYAVYERLYKAMLEKDTHTINELMMNGSHLVHMTGYKQPKIEWLNAIEDESMKYYSAQEENIEIRMKDKKATLVARNRVDARINGFRHTWPLELTMSLVKFEKEWKISHVEATTY